MGEAKQFGGYATITLRHSSADISVSERVPLAISFAAQPKLYRERICFTPNSVAKSYKTVKCQFPNTAL